MLLEYDFFQAFSIISPSDLLTVFLWKVSGSAKKVLVEVFFLKILLGSFLAWFEGSWEHWFSCYIVHRISHDLADSLPSQVPWSAATSVYSRLCPDMAWCGHLSCMFHLEINFWYQIFICKESFKLSTVFGQNVSPHEASNYFNKCVGHFRGHFYFGNWEGCGRHLELQPDVITEGSEEMGRFILRALFTQKS